MVVKWGCNQPWLKQAMVVCGVLLHGVVALVLVVFGAQKFQGTWVMPVLAGLMVAGTVAVLLALLPRYRHVLGRRLWVLACYGVAWLGLGGLWSFYERDQRRIGQQVVGAIKARAQQGCVPEVEVRQLLSPFEWRNARLQYGCRGGQMWLSYPARRGGHDAHYVYDFAKQQWALQR